MEDQFGGRTDDDLFYDDLEPVESEAVVISEQPNLTPATTNPPAHASAPSPQKSPSKTSQGLSASRFADSPEPPKQQSPPVAAAPQSAETAPSTAKAPPQGAPSGPEKHQKGNAGNNKNNEHRAGSGANPRQKLTEDELSAKMQQVKLLNAEKERKFERATQDEKQHAESYARGMEEARRRRKEAEERGKRGEESQRKLNDEREKNGERKLKAMGAKEGGSWDEGKVEQLEEERRRGFKGANGGIRGTRRGGLGNSRFAEQDVPDVDRFLDDGGRGRGRGRGGRGRGGGRGGHEGAAREPEPSKSQTVPKVEDFPELPKNETKEPRDVAPPAMYSPGKGGAWDEEMEDLEAEKNKRWGVLGDWAEHVEEELEASYAPKTGEKLGPSKQSQHNNGRTRYSVLQLEGREVDNDTGTDESVDGERGGGVANQGSETDAETCKENDYDADDEAGKPAIGILKPKRVDTEAGHAKPVEAKAIAIRKARAAKTLGVVLVEMPADRRTESWLRHVQARSKDIKCTILVRGRRIHSRLVWI